jgi:hypothetical protein
MQPEHGRYGAWAKALTFHWHELDYYDFRILVLGRQRYSFENEACNQKKAA